jgi:hypothetical protein
MSEKPRRGLPSWPLLALPIIAALALVAGMWVFFPPGPLS